MTNLRVVGRKPICVSASIPLEPLLFFFSSSSYLVYVPCVFSDLNTPLRLFWRCYNIAATILILLRWTGGLSRVSPAFALCQLGSAPAPRDPNEDEAVLITDGWILILIFLLVLLY